MLDSREPPHGDFVAYIERIEREQLARALQPHRLQHLTAGGAVASEHGAGNKPHALSAAEAQRVPAPSTGRRNSTAPVGATIGVIIGAALVAFGLLAEGGIVLVVLGAVLLWHSLRKLRRRADPAQVPLGRQVDQAFGQKASSPTRGR